MVHLGSACCITCVAVDGRSAAADCAGWASAPYWDHPQLDVGVRFSCPETPPAEAWLTCLSRNKLGSRILCLRTTSLSAGSALHSSRCILKQVGPSFPRPPRYAPGSAGITANAEGDPHA